MKILKTWWKNRIEISKQVKTVFIIILSAIGLGLFNTLLYYL